MEVGGIADGTNMGSWGNGGGDLCGGQGGGRVGDLEVGSRHCVGGVVVVKVRDLDVGVWGVVGVGGLGGEIGGGGGSRSRGL